jgi:hypothetical protein
MLHAGICINVVLLTKAKPKQRNYTLKNGNAFKALLLIKYQT